MKRIVFILLATLFCKWSNGQNANNHTGYKNGKPCETSRYIKCTGFHVTKPLRELANGDYKRPESETEVNDKQEGNKPPDFQRKGNYPADPLIQHNAGSIPLDTTLTNFEGVNYYVRPDPTGAAGPDNYVQAANLCRYSVYDKAGNLLLATDISVLGITPLDDPMVMYDKFADRWVIACVSSYFSNLWHLSVAVSTTPDPTGSYYVYTYACPYMPDFDKLSIWTDGYYVTYRHFPYDSVGVAVLERNRMLKGDTSTGIIISAFPNTHIINQNSQLPGSPKVLFCDGNLPPFGTPEYLMYYTNVNMGDPSNSIMIYQLNTDTTAKICVVSFVDSLATAPYNGYFAGYAFTGNIREPHDSFSNSLEGTFQYRVPYIRFTGYSSVVLCNTVNLGDSIAGIRWYELRQNDTTQKWSIYQQGTYGPNDSISRWNSSICMDMYGDISLAYNVTNATNLYPGIRFTGRLASDPPGQMTFAEQTAIIGKHSFINSWGDYSESWLDPDGVTFWHTNQYIIDPTAKTANVRIFSFRLTSPTGVPSIRAAKANLQVYQSDNYLNVIASNLLNDDAVVVNLFDINGKQLNTQWVNPQGNMFQAKINVGNFAKGVYLVRIGNMKFQKVSKVVVE